MNEHEQLVALCEKFGATPAQADIMARQLAKRADQLAMERGCTRVEAMSYLLTVLIKGRNGEGPDEQPDANGRTDTGAR
jgi:hypothetical protein